MMTIPRPAPTEPPEDGQWDEADDGYYEPEWCPECGYELNHCPCGAGQQIRQDRSRAEALSQLADLPIHVLAALAAEIGHLWPDLGGAVAILAVPLPGVTTDNADSETSSECLAAALEGRTTVTVAIPGSSHRTVDQSGQAEPPF